MHKVIEQIKNKSKELKKIKLAECYDLTILPPELKECENLESLDISYTSITSIPDFVFHLPKLKKLSYLGCKELARQPAGLKHAKGLESIAIYIPTGQRFPEDVYALNKLKSLTVQGEIDVWEDRVCSMTGLEELISFDTRIKDLPDSIDRMKRLKKVSFWQPLFSETTPVIPLVLDSIFKKLAGCDSLKTLELDRNGLCEIPESIGLLKSLQRFSAKENTLTKFPAELYTLTNLRELDLGVNQIAEIPKGIGNLVNLKVLKLNSNWKNRLNTENLFAEIDKLENLEVLELWSCQTRITTPEKIKSLKKLKVLDLNNNQIVALFDMMNGLSHIKFRR